MTRALPPLSQWQAQQYLREHGREAPHSERAQWILGRFTAWQQDPGARYMDWSETAWRRHQAEQREAMEVAA